VLIKPFHVGPGPLAVLGRRRMFATDTEGIHPLGCQGQESFETDIALPVGHEVVDVPEPFTTMETQVTQQYVTSLGIAAAILSAVDVEAVQMLITPSQHDVQDRVEVRQCGVAADEQAAPDEGADAA
jgi:hypothetical protein